MSFTARFREIKEYNTVSILKTGDQGTTEIVKDKAGVEYIRKQIPYIGLPYDKLRQLCLDGVPHIFKVEEIVDKTYKEETTCVIEEKIQGINLFELKGRNGYLSEELVKRIAVSLCDILLGLHQEGILHRDIKPSNIMLDFNEKVWLIDFGSSRRFKEEYDETKNQDTYVMITRTFAPPEQYGSGVTTPRSDIYSLGKTMLTLLGEEYDGFLKEILLQCTKDDPEQRYQSAKELKENILNSNANQRTLYISALNGDSRSQYDLGCWYEAEKKYVQALFWLEKSICQNVLHDSYKAEAAFRMGRIYQYGLGEACDLKKAEKYYTKSQEYGYVDADVALYNLKTDNKSAVAVMKIKARRFLSNILTPVMVVLFFVVCVLGCYIYYNNTEHVKEEKRARAEQFLALGDEAALKNDFTMAISSYNKGLSLNDASPELYLSRALAYYRRGERTETVNKQIISDCEKAIKYGDKEISNYRKGIAYFCMGSIQFERKEYKQVIDNYSKALTLFVDENQKAIMLMQQGVSYRKLNDYESSLNTFKN